MLCVEYRALLSTLPSHRQAPLGHLTRLPFKGTAIGRHTRTSGNLEGWAVQPREPGCAMLSGTSVTTQVFSRTA